MRIGKGFRKKKQILYMGLVLLILTYLGGLLFYRDHLLPRTSMAGVKLSELNPNQAQAKFSQALSDRVISIQEDQQDLGQISLDKLGLEAEIEEVIKERIQHQNAFFWPVSLFLPNKLPLGQEVLKFDPGLLEGLIQALGIDNNQRPSSHNAIIQENSDGSFYIQEEVYGQQVSGTSFSQALKKQIDNNQALLDLKQAYILPEFTKDSDQILKQKAYLDKILATQLTLEFDGHSVTIDPVLINDWLSVNAQGQASLDEEEIRNFVFDLNEKYAARFKDKTFNSTYQGQVLVPAGTFGWFIDADQEAPAIAEALRQAKDQVRQPIIVGAGYGMDPSEAIGNSYVEVDLTYQMMLIYREGQLVLDTPIVSGRIGTETTPGAYVVWNKEEKSILRGYNPRLEEDYEIPVAYWIAFDYVGQGIHDATWLSSFGGTVYQQSGSLGCINTPLNIMGEVFSIVDYGWPVLVFN